MLRAQSGTLEYQQKKKTSIVVYPHFRKPPTKPKPLLRVKLAGLPRSNTCCCDTHGLSGSSGLSSEGIRRSKEFAVNKSAKYQDAVMMMKIIMFIIIIVTIFLLLLFFIVIITIIIVSTIIIMTNVIIIVFTIMIICIYVYIYIHIIYTIGDHCIYIYTRIKYHQYNVWC